MKLLTIAVPSYNSESYLSTCLDSLVKGDERVKGDEGCLSVPGIYDGVERAERVRVRALDEHGQAREIEAEGLLAVCIQHEMDHLRGKVFVDYLSPLKRGRIKTRLLKAERLERPDRQRVPV